MVHFVLTRFNARSHVWNSDVALDADWLEHRFALFERFCLLAMASQTASTRWLVFFDAHTPARFLRRVARHSAVVPGLEVVLVDGPLTDTDVAACVARRLPDAAVKLCTTRLDNDDAIRRDYLMRVQVAASAARGPQFINFPFGYQWNADALYLWYEAANPFVSRVESVARGAMPHTVMCDVAHRDVGAVGPVRQVLAWPMWIQVVHDRNVANRLRGMRRLGLPPPRRFADGIVERTRGPVPLKDFVISVWRIVRAGKRYVVRRIESRGRRRS